MQFLQMSIYIVAYLCVFFLNVYCEKDDVIPSTPELTEIQSFFYMFAKEDLTSPVAEIEKNQSLTISQSCSYREPDKRNTQETIFYKRLIAILLSKLKMQRIDDRLVGTLTIEVFSSELEYLQKFVNGQGSIREVDRILINAITGSEYSARDYMTEASYYFNLLLSKTSENLIYYISPMEDLMYYMSLIKDRWDITIIFFIVIASFMILRRQKSSRGLLIFLVIDVIFVISFVINWWRLVQEAEIKLMAAQAKFREMPIACQPHKMNFWDKMYEWLSPTNNCEKYYETIMTNPRLQVTPAFVLTNLLTTIIFQPLTYLGLVISEFIDNATSKLNFFYKIPIILALFLSICICIILIPFSWIGGSINFGFGPFFKFGMKGRRNSNKNQGDRIERIYEEVSPKRRLKDSGKIKQIMLGQDNDLAGGDADMHHLVRYKKCQCEKKADGDAECIKKEEKPY
ncbi:CLCC1 protein, partial [Acromyrmex insinuator]